MNPLFLFNFRTNIFKNLIKIECYSFIVNLFSQNDFMQHSRFYVIQKLIRKEGVQFFSEFHKCTALVGSETKTTKTTKTFD